jgi:COP9 signalosome complex subunit 1
MEDSAMKQFLELVPDVREIISDFYHSRYSSCLALMEKIRGDLMLDMYMNAHVEKLYGMIRSKALIQYFTPFASVQMEMMSQAFSTTVPQLQKELTELIMKKDIKARIDSHNKIIYARQADQEVITCQWAFVLCVDCLASTSHLAVCFLSSQEWTLLRLGSPLLDALLETGI